MSDSTAPRGRGRGRGRRIGGATLSGSAAEPTSIASPSPAPEPRSRATTSTSGSATPAPFDPSTFEDAPTAGAGGSGSERATPGPGPVRRVPSVGVASSRAPSVGIGNARDRSVGGLLGSQSSFKAAGPGGAAAGGRPKFRPNVAAAAARRKEKDMQISDEEDIKEEEESDWKKRGPRAPRPRQDLEMTASGPMAQGPGGAPRTWGARAATASGAAVMAASREGTLNAQLNQDEDASDLEGYDSETGESRRTRIRATDLNDIGLSDDGGSEDEDGNVRKGVPPLVLPRDPKVLRTKIRRLQERKTERLKKEARKAAGDPVVIKDEPRDDTMSVDGTPSATPGPSEAKSGVFDSKESTFAGFELDEKEAKDLKDLEEEEKKEINLSEAFDLKDDNRLDLYMFQFPRKFPFFAPKSTPKLDGLSLDDPERDGDKGDGDSKRAIKPDPEASQTSAAAVRKPVPPEWGRSGTREQKAARWSQDRGKIGKLRVHKSGKVTLKLAGDLKYEVLPAAQPSFLQEIAVLDHPMRSKKDRAGENGNGKKSKKASSEKKKNKKGKAKREDGSNSDESSSGEGSDSNDGSSSSSSDDDQPRWSKHDPPPNSLVCIGQTSKKFIVVPEIADLLDKVKEQEKREKEEERRIKGARIKKEATGGPAGKAK
ncbi:hypothetical protein JCM10212_006209 [Sporobolomyces blumeae]